MDEGGSRSGLPAVSRVSPAIGQVLGQAQPYLREVIVGMSFPDVRAFRRGGSGELCGILYLCYCKAKRVKLSLQ